MIEAIFIGLLVWWAFSKMARKLPVEPPQIIVNILVMGEPDARGKTIDQDTGAPDLQGAARDLRQRGGPWQAARLEN